MVNCISADECIGCSACMHTCAAGAIKLQHDNEGFYTAKVDEGLCVNCGLCKSVCPLINDVSDYANDFLQAYAAYSKHEKTRHNSTSGGIFQCIAKHFIEKYNGIVFGVYMNKEHEALHIAVDNTSDLIKLQGSKYLQSNLNDVFKQIKEYLDNDRHVLFSGTGCQVSGLKRFLKKTYNNLLTVDIICHGVPSPTLFKDYIRFLEKRYKGKITDYKFRVKNEDYKHQSYDTRITFNTGKKEYEKIICGDEDIFTSNYISNKLQKKECFNCQFTSLKRCGDITLGDYWGFYDVHQQTDTINGISLVLVNSVCGQEIINRISDNIVLIPSDKEKILYRNYQLIKPPQMDAYRNILYSKYRPGKFGYYYYLRYFMGRKFIVYLLKRKIKQLLGRG